MLGKEEWGMGTVAFSFLLPNLFWFPPRPPYSFSTINVGKLGSVLGKKQPFLLIGLDRLLSLSGNWHVGDGFSALPDMVHPSHQPLDGNTKAGTKKKVPTYVLIPSVRSCSFILNRRLMSSKSVKIWLLEAWSVSSDQINFISRIGCLSWCQKEFNLFSVICCFKEESGLGCLLLSSFSYL